MQQCDGISYGTSSFADLLVDSMKMAAAAAAADNKNRQKPNNIWTSRVDAKMHWKERFDKRNAVFGQCFSSSRSHSIP